MAAEPTTATSDYRSSNLNKYTTTNRLYGWHIQKFHDHITGLVAGVRPTRVLDVGCGEGFLSAHLKADMPNVDFVGVDASEGAIAYARKEFESVGEFIVGDIFALPYEDNSFDVVLCSEVLEHLDEAGTAFAELARVARTHVIITVPLEPYFKFFNDISRKLGISPDPGHVNFWRHLGFQDFISGLCPGASFSKVHYYQAAVCPVGKF